MPEDFTRADAMKEAVEMLQKIVDATAGSTDQDASFKAMRNVLRTTPIRGNRKLIIGLDAVIFTCTQILQGLYNSGDPVLKEMIENTLNQYADEDNDKAKVH